MEASSSTPRVLRRTWLSQKPEPLAAVAMAISTLMVVILSLVAWADVFAASSWMQASRQQVFVQHEFWRAWSTLFVHGDAKHLLGNTFLFFILGTFLAGYFGIFRVLLSALFFGGITNLVVLSRMPLQTSLIGLSGVVFWMGGAWLVLYFLLERQRTVVQRLLRTLGVTLMLFMPAEAFEPTTSYSSHLIGFVLGGAAGLFYFSVAKKSLRAAEVYEELREAEEAGAAEAAPVDSN